MKRDMPRVGDRAQVRPDARLYCGTDMGGSIGTVVYVVECGSWQQNVGVTLEFATTERIFFGLGEITVVRSMAGGAA